MQKITIIDPNHEKKHGILNSIFTKITLKCHKIDHFQHFHQPKKTRAVLLVFKYRTCSCISCVCSAATAGAGAATAGATAAETPARRTGGKVLREYPSYYS